jgi:hypothetical protein
MDRKEFLKAINTAGTAVLLGSVVANGQKTMFFPTSKVSWIGGRNTLFDRNRESSYGRHKLRLLNKKSRLFAFFLGKAIEIR